MKTSERFDYEDHQIHITQKHDVTQTLKRAQMMRDADAAGHTGAIPADWKPIGTVPAIMLRKWCDEAGVRMDDRRAVEEVINKKLMSNEFSKFRVQEGKFII
jgi:hypothetical protein